MSRESKKRLLARIDQSGEPLSALAARVGVSQSTLWNFIHGETKNFSKLHHLAAALSVSLDWIQHGDRAEGQPAETAHPSLAPTLIVEAWLRAIGCSVARLARAHTDLPEDSFGDMVVTAWKETRGQIASQAADAVAGALQAQVTHNVARGKTAKKR